MDAQKSDSKAWMDRSLSGKFKGVVESIKYFFKAHAVLPLRIGFGATSNAQKLFPRFFSLYEVRAAGSGLVQGQ